MVAQVSTVADVGEQTRGVEVRCELAFGIPRFAITGLPDRAGVESRARIQAALAAMGLALPPKRITIELSPADLAKPGSHYDLPIALALLAAIGVIAAERLTGVVALGELSPDGRILASPSRQRAATHARESGKTLICAPADPSRPGRPGDVPIIAATTLVGLIRQLKAPPPAEQPAPAPEPDRHKVKEPPAAAFTIDAQPFDIGAFDIGPIEHDHEDPDAWRSKLRDAMPFMPSAHGPRRQDGPAREDRNRRDHPSSREAPPRREPDPDFHGIGHRSRLRTRLIEGGVDALADYEVLEFLLFGARRRGDTKPLAKALMKRFGSLPAVLNADPVALKQVPGIGTASVGVLRIAAVAAKRAARAQVIDQPVLGSWSALIEYLAIDMAHLTRERVRVLYLDRKNRLVKDEHISEGTIDEASVHPREVIHHALDVGASALILVHNHPSGSPEPSPADIKLTHRIAEAGRLVDITVHDHVIVGREGHVSLREKGLI